MKPLSSSTRSNDGLSYTPSFACDREDPLHAQWTEIANQAIDRRELFFFSLLLLEQLGATLGMGPSYEPGYQTPRSWRLGWPPIHPNDWRAIEDEWFARLQNAPTLSHLRNEFDELLAEYLASRA